MMWFLLSRDIWGNRMKTTEYKEKFERVFQQIGKATNSIWKVEDQANLLACKTHIQGQAVKINLRIDSYDKVKARIFLGDYRTDGNRYFSKDISFTAKKSEYQITQEILKRLEIDSLDEKITKLLEYRKSSDEMTKRKESIIYLCKRLLPQLGEGGGKLSMMCDDTRIIFDPHTTRLEIVNYDKDPEMIIAVLGRISEFLRKK